MFSSENFTSNQKFWAICDLIKNFEESLYLWHTWTWTWTCDTLVVNSSHAAKHTFPFLISNVCSISNTRDAHIILCFRSICIQTVAFWLYLTFIQQFGASYTSHQLQPCVTQKKLIWIAFGTFRIFFRYESFSSFDM